MKEIDIKFSKSQKLPDGYKIQWWEADEHYLRVRRNKGRIAHTHAILERMREHFNIPVYPMANKVTIEQ